MKIYCIINAACAALACIRDAVRRGERRMIMSTLNSPDRIIRRV